MKPGPKPKPPTSRFWPKVSGGSYQECWLWIGGRKPDGYGRFYVDRERPHCRAHRFAYEELIGDIPEGLQLDHLCRNPSCVNPWHLEPVIEEENHRRAIARCAKWSSCAKGHSFSPENTVHVQPTPQKRRRRYCITCQLAKAPRDRDTAFLKAYFPDASSTSSAPNPADFLGVA